MIKRKIFFKTTKFNVYDGNVIFLSRVIPSLEPRVSSVVNKLCGQQWNSGFSNKTMYAIVGNVWNSTGRQCIDMV